MTLVVFGDFMPKVDIIKFLIPLAIFSLAFFNILSIKKTLKSKQIYLLFFTILFGFLNGLGSSTDFMLQLESNESELLSILEVVLGAGSSILIIIVALLLAITLLKKVSKIERKKMIVAFSVIIAILSLPLMFTHIFN